MRERIIIILLTALTLLGVIGFYERRHAKLLKNNTELNAKYTEVVEKNAKMSLLNYKTRKELAEIKENCYYRAKILEERL